MKIPDITTYIYGNISISSFCVSLNALLVVVIVVHCIINFDGEEMI